MKTLSISVITDNENPAIEEITKFLEQIDVVAFSSLESELGTGEGIESNKSSFEIWVYEITDKDINKILQFCEEIKHDFHKIIVEEVEFKIVDNKVIFES